MLHRLVEVLRNSASSLNRSAMTDSLLQILELLMQDPDPTASDLPEASAETVTPMVRTPLYTHHGCLLSFLLVFLKTASSKTQA